MNITPKQIRINTISPTYDMNEDRIRLSLNYKDLHNRVDMMLTRSFLLKVLPSLEEFTYKYYPEEPIEDTVTLQQNLKPTQSTKVAKQNKSSSISPTNVDDLELYKGLEDLLWTLNLSFDTSTKLTTLILESKNKHQATLKCDIHVLKNIIKSIKQAVPMHTWSIAL